MTKYASALDYTPSDYVDINASTHPKTVAEYVTDYFTSSGIPFSPNELAQSLISLTELQQLTNSEDLCRFVFDVVAAQQINKEFPWRWIGIELSFEVIVAKFLDRDKAILASTASISDLDTSEDLDFYLDVHNERKSRFEKYLCWYGLPAISMGKPIVISK